jgi:phosphate transport system protein
METHFHQQLSGLKLRTLELAALTEKAVISAVTALNDRDADAASQVVDNDEYINRLQAGVDEACLTLLALEQPVATDLRFIVGSIHIAANLERAADQAVNIAERALLFSRRPEQPSYPPFDELAELATSMLSDAIVAYNQDDTELALAVCARDPRADELNLAILKHYVDVMIAENRAAEWAVHRIILARCLERVGDLATNIAEYVLFIVKDVNVKASCHRL